KVTGWLVWKNTREPASPLWKPDQMRWGGAFPAGGRGLRVAAPGTTPTYFSPDDAGTGGGASAARSSGDGVSAGSAALAAAARATRKAAPRQERRDRTDGSSAETRSR